MFCAMAEANDAERSVGGPAFANPFALTRGDRRELEYAPVKDYDEDDRDRRAAGDHEEADGGEHGRGRRRRGRGGGSGTLGG